MTDHDFMRRLALVSVHMHGCTHQRGPGSVGTEHTVETGGEIQAIDNLPDGQVAYLVTLNYRIANTETEDEVAAGAVGFIAAYQLAEGPALTAEQIERFGQTGALFQVHPYIREHVATMCQRSGLTPYMLPMLFHNEAGAVDASDAD